MMQIATLTCLLLSAAPTPDELASPKAEQSSGPRVRFGVTAGVLVDNHPAWAKWPHRPELSGTINLGVQLSDQVAVYALTQISTIIVGSAGKMGVLAEYTILDGMLSFGTGAAVSLSSEACMLPAAICWHQNDTDNIVPSLGIPARASVNFGQIRHNGHRHRFSLVLDGYAGLVFDKEGFTIQRAPIQGNINTNVFNCQAGFGIGYQMM